MSKCSCTEKKNVKRCTNRQPGFLESVGQAISLKIGCKCSNKGTYWKVSVVLVRVRQPRDKERKWELILFLLRLLGEILLDFSTDSCAG